MARGNMDKNKAIIYIDIYICYLSGRGFFAYAAS
ncbi:hypothetical protein Xind_00521 [Xenorhabdus indica]|nr:hypothetical protein [Xenorhabdus indica]